MVAMFLRSLVLIACVACGDSGQGNCQVAADCGQDSECVTHRCTGGTCSTDPTERGFVVAGQTSGDCQELRCDGAGNIESFAVDDPAIDQNPCTIETCVAGVPTQDNAAAQTACGTGLTCDGSGNCVQCASASQCPGSDDECQTRTCSAGMCGFAFASAGTPRTQQTAGDCHRAVCDGAGGTSSMIDDNDRPADDGNACTGEVCTQGAPSHPNVATGTACGTGLKCDGAGSCVACLADNECPATGNECSLPDCTAGTCGTANAPTGTVLSMQTAGDCKQAICDGAGGTTAQNDDNDLPVDDGNACTSEACFMGVPVHNNLPTGTACGTGKCDGAGSCVACLVDNDCPATGSECVLPHCSAGTCGTAFAPTGTPLSTQTPGDCKTAVCDGSGGTMPQNDDSDIPDDGNPCTMGACNQGTPLEVFVPDGSPCGTGMTCTMGVCS
jgi:hypothetical protein